MDKKIYCINILPARFLDKKDDMYLIRVLLENDVIEDRFFGNILFDEITNPDYLFISIITGINLIRVDFFDANNFKKMFNNKWKTLIK